jgi:hypothetical protein
VPISRQTRRPARGARGTFAGIGVDALGGPVIDPTENVLALVDVQTIHQNEMRVAESQYQNGMREAEVRRLSDLASLKERYDKQISDILTIQVKTTSELISTQLDKVTNSLSSQINTAAAQNASLMGTLSDRIGKLEQSKWEVAGRTSVQDPATAATLVQISSVLKTLSETRNEGMGQMTARKDVGAWLAFAVMAVLAAAALFIKH